MRKQKLIFNLLIASGCIASLPVLAIQHQDFSQQLGWLRAADSPSLCKGYYNENELEQWLPQGLGLDSVAIRADSGDYLFTGWSSLTGQVSIAEHGRRVTADQADILKENAIVKVLDLTGHVVLEEPGRLVIADKAHYLWDKEQGSLLDVLYRWTLGEPLYSLAKDGKHRLLYGLVGWGQAQRAEQHSKSLMTLYHSNFTTCHPEAPVWQLSTSKLTLNKTTGRGMARNMVLRVKDVPIFYVPFFSFPIDKRRQSGFLFPTYGYTNRSGFDISIPYYWNIAPNYDATLTSRIMEKRGVQLKGALRYLTQTSVGSIGLEYLPNDKTLQTFQADAKKNYPTSPLLTDLLAASDDRYLLHWQNNTRFNDHWTSSIDFTKVSDDYYFQDFGINPNVINDTQLLQQAAVRYTGNHWTFLGRLQQVQTLHPINRAYVEDQYSRLPQLLWTANYPQLTHGLDFSLNTELVHFDRPKDPLTRFVYPTGNRFDIKPEISKPLRKEWGYLTPSLQFELTQYDIQDQLGQRPGQITRAVPIFNLDSGLYFTRTTHWFNKAYEQTLEPRVYYLYVPYVQQHNIPLFDSAWLPLTFAQLFNTNRFTGIDRIGDANQITLAATSRFIDQDSGTEKLRASIGQIYYFQNRKVGLDDKLLPPDKQSSQNRLGALSSTANFSPLIGELNYHIAKSWYFLLNGGYDFQLGQVYSSGASFQYAPNPGRLLNLGYNYMRNGDLLPNGQIINLNMADISLAWPLKGKQWKFIGRWNYNLGQSHVQNVFSGLEYNTCCWAIRFIANKSFTAFNEINSSEFDTGFYMQLQLKGLGNFSTNDPTTILMSGIPGYQNNFGEI